MTPNRVLEAPAAGAGDDRQPQVGAWLARWEQISEAFTFVSSRKALLVEGAGWRVELGPGTDITITVRGVQGR